MNSTIASPPGNHITKGTTSKSTQPPRTQKPKTNRHPRLTYRSEAHERLSKQTAQEAHTEKGVIYKEPPSEQTRTIASLCLHKHWRRTPRPSLKPLYLEETTLPIQSSTRTLSISVTCLISPSDEHQEDPMAQGAQAGQEAQTILTEDHPDQQPYPLLISFPSNPQEISNWPEYPLYSSMATEPELMPSSENSGST